MCGIRGKNSTSTLNKNNALQINNDHATSYSDDECAIMIQSRFQNAFTTNNFRNSFDQKVKR